MVLIEPALRSAFPEIFCLSLQVTGIDPVALAPIAAAELQRGAAQVREDFAGVSQISDHPAIAPWRAAYGAAGVKPSKYRSSIESLVRRALNGDPPSIDPIVDLYNGVSMRFGVAMGAVDAALAVQPIELRFCQPDSDSFQPIGGQESDFPKLPSIPVYAMGSAILCWCFNCRDAAPTAISTETDRAIFFTEGTSEAQRTAATAALTELSRLFGLVGASSTIDEDSALATN